jgi:cation transport ATPase
VRRAFGFALSYNLSVVALSAATHMNPLLAAVLMPLSSVVSILLVASGSEPRRRRQVVADPVGLGREVAMVEGG